MVMRSFWASLLLYGLFAVSILVFTSQKKLLMQLPLCHGRLSMLSALRACWAGVCRHSYYLRYFWFTAHSAINMALAFCMGTDMNALLSSPIGQPMAQIFFNSFGQNGTLALWSFVVLVQCASLHVCQSVGLTATALDTWWVLVWYESTLEYRMWPQY